METSEYYVFSKLLEWLYEGKKVTLCTVLKTWGGAPRPAGAIAAICEDGQVVGSVSGGCIEDDLVDYLAKNNHEKCMIKSYGPDNENHSHMMLPCGSKLDVFLEPIKDVDPILQIVSAINERKNIQRTVDVNTGNSRVFPAEHNDDMFSYDGHYVSCVFGPLWQLVIVGAGDISRFVSQMALMLNYKIIVCDPREEYYQSWNVNGVELDTGMPDDVILAKAIDSRTAVVTLTHDPKLDDMALIEALKSEAFYVGALGSNKTNKQRRQRLRKLGIIERDLDKLHGPVGITIGSRTPPEIAISILAELIQEQQKITRLGH